jgi:hypothetical protein
MEKLRRVLVHERHELDLMLRRKLSYREAHRLASKHEKRVAGG